VLDREDR